MYPVSPDVAFEPIVPPERGGRKQPAGNSKRACLDRIVISERIQSMKTLDQTTVDAETLAVIEHAMTGKPLDPEIARRVREQSRKSTEAMRERVGAVEIAAELVRQT